MATEDFLISISAKTTDEFAHVLSADPRFGADFTFLGVVRDLEDSRKITGIDYSCYEPMALEELRRICEEQTAANENHRILVHHRIGFVPAGEPSIIIRVQTPHSKPGFERCQAYLAEIKRRVPIWKRPVFEE